MRRLATILCLILVVVIGNVGVGHADFRLDNSNKISGYDLKIILSGKVNSCTSKNHSDFGSGKKYDFSFFANGKIKLNINDLLEDEGIWDISSDGEVCYTFRFGRLDVCHVMYRHPNDTKKIGFESPDTQILYTCNISEPVDSSATIAARKSKISTAEKGEQRLSIETVQLKAQAQPKKDSGLTLAKRTQEALRVLGLYSGIIDGIIDVRIKSATREWQRRNSYSETGEITETQIVKLEEDASQALATQKPSPVDASSVPVVSSYPGRRKALVIGNNNYKTLPRLNNALKDAEGISFKLRELGWDVILEKDIGHRQAYRTIAMFKSKLEEADVGLFYYSGHGIQSEGENYLVPSDAEIEIETDLQAEAFTATHILEVMEDAGAPLNIVILDSCRDNPLPRRTRSGKRGLATPVIPSGIKGTAIVFSAGPGQVAMDGAKDGHGVFTGELLKVLDRPGLKLEEVFKETARQVFARTKGKQKPWINSSLTGDFYFRERKATQTVSALALDKEAMFWQSIQDSRNPASYEAYLFQYPKGAFASLAKIKMAELKPKQVAVSRPPLTLQAAGKAAPVLGMYPRRYKAGEIFKDCFICPEMVVIPAGSFRMGDLSGIGHDNEKPVHEVRIGYNFAVGKYEITQAEWKSVMGSNPSSFKGARNPVEQVSWYDANAFVAKLTKKTGKEYRLLSEAEWEYMTRAGSTTDYPWGDRIDRSKAKYDSKSTAPVGSYSANAFGVHDAIGNVWEWLEDCWHWNYDGAPSDGSARTKPCVWRSLRGGSWSSSSNPRNLRSSIRNGINSRGRYSYVGFRIARTLLP